MSKLVSIKKEHILKQAYTNYGKNVNDILGNFPKYYINLDRSTNRYKSMEGQISFYDIQNIFRISAVDGKKIENLYSGKIELAPGKTFEYLNTAKKFLSTELGCTLSHLRAIHTSYTKGDNFAIIMEDDAGLGLIPFWEEDIKQIIAGAPQDWQIISLWANKKACLKTKGYLPYPKYICWGTLCYIISRSGMESVLKCIKNSTIFLDDPLQADLYIYLYAKTYTYTKKPLFYLMTAESTISDGSQIDEIDWEQSSRNIDYYILDPEEAVIKRCKPTREEIPKIIHQTWKTKTLPDSYQRWSDEIKAMHLDWEHKLWTDEENRNFIAKNYSWFLGTYDSYDKHIKRVDAVRYFLLYHYGGVYIDMDMTTLKKIDPLMKNGYAIFGYQLADKNKKGSIANAFMATPPKHPLFEILIHSLKYTKNKNVLEATGPEYLTNTVKKYQGEDIIVYEMPIIYTHEWDSKDPDLVKCDKQLDYCRRKYQKSYTITFWTGSWLGKELFYQLPRCITGNGTGIPQLIPKNMVKILITSDDKIPLVPEYLSDCVQSWINLNPEYNFTLLDKKDCIKFLETHFTKKVVDSFNSLKPYAYKCDLARICWLYINGGVYSDFRMKLLKPLREILKPDIFFCIPNDLVSNNGCKNPLINSFIASVPKNPLLAKIIDAICDNVSNKYYGKCSLYPTGPVVVGNTIRSVVGGDGPFNPGLYKWKEKNYEILKFDKDYIKQDNKNIIKTKPAKNEFTTDISVGNVYWKMWKNKDVYN